jgi:hypothetical protein
VSVGTLHGDKTVGPDLLVAPGCPVQMLTPLWRTMEAPEWPWSMSPHGLHSRAGKVGLGGRGHQGRVDLTVWKQIWAQFLIRICYPQLFVCFRDSLLLCSPAGLELMIPLP